MLKYFNLSTFPTLQTNEQYFKTNEHYFNLPLHSLLFLELLVINLNNIRKMN